MDVIGSSLRRVHQVAEKPLTSVPASGTKALEKDAKSAKMPKRFVSPNPAHL